MRSNERPAVRHRAMKTIYLTRGCVDYEEDYVFAAFVQKEDAEKELKTYNDSWTDKANGFLINGEYKYVDRLYIQEVNLYE